MVAVTSLPDAPAWLSGVINLRGRLVPVVDLRLRLGVGAPAVDLSTPIVIASHGDGVVGLIVDAVSGIVDVADLRWHGRSAAGEGSFVLGIGHLDDRLVLVVDLDRVCDGVEALVPEGV